MKDQEIKDLIEDLSSIGLHNHYPSILTSGDNDIEEILSQDGRGGLDPYKNLFVIKAKVDFIEVLPGHEITGLQYDYDSSFFVRICISRNEFYLKAPSEERAFQIAKDILNFIQ